MKTLLLLFLITFTATAQKAADTKAINILLDEWHAAAARADYNAFFDKIAEDGIYIGTDATENWNKKDFAVWAKPYFDKGKAWSFTALERHVFLSSDGKMAWFDELLNTQMKICRGSGVLEKTAKGWKIKHYVLSMTIPNDDADKVIEIKSGAEDVIIKSYIKRKEH